MRVGLLVAVLVPALGPLAVDADARALHALAFRACIEDAGLDGCGTGAVNEAPRLNGARGVAVSPDGRSVYVASSTDDSVSRFDRGVNGTLTFAGCFEDVGLDGCATGTANETPGLDGASGVAVSPDGRSVYVTGLPMTPWSVSTGPPMARSHRSVVSRMPVCLGAAPAPRPMFPV